MNEADWTFLLILGIIAGMMLNLFLTRFIKDKATDHYMLTLLVVIGSLIPGISTIVILLAIIGSRMDD